MIKYSKLVVEKDFYEHIYEYLYDIMDAYDMFEKHENGTDLFIDYKYFLLDLLENKVTDNNVGYEKQIVNALRGYKNSIYVDDITSAIYHLSNVIDDIVYSLNDNY